MNWLTRFSMKNIGLIFLAILLVIGGGLYAVSTMKMEQFPNVDIPYMSVQVVYPGATPNQVLEDIGKPMEQALSTVKDVKNLYVTSAANACTVFLEFNMDKAMDQAETEVNAAVNKVHLPDTAQKPDIRRQGPSSDVVYSFAVGGGGAEQETVQQFIEDKVRPSLATVPDVANVVIDGTTEKKIYIKLDPDKMKAHNLTLDKVKQALIANNVALPTGDVTMSGKTMNVQVGQALQSLDDVKNVNLVLIEQNMSGMTDAFQNLGAGMNQLGHAVGGIGQSVGSLAKGQGLMQQEIQLIGGLNQLSGQMMQDQAALQALQANPNAQKDPALQAKAAQLSAKVKGEQAKIAELQGTLGGVQSALRSQGTETQQLLQGLQGSSTPAPNPSQPSPNTNVQMNITTLKISDIAAVTYGSEEAGAYTRLNGKPAVIVGISPSIGANTVDLVTHVKSKLKGLTLPKDYVITTLRDQSTEIKKSVDAMLREAIFGALLAAVVTLLFLRNIRTTVVALLSIPLSILITMMVMKALDYSLNMMTLAGIAVAVGRVVDDSIVVIENLYRRIQQSRPEQRNETFVVAATSEVSQAITSSTITTIGVFGPLAFVPGIVGKFFAPFAISIVISLAFSLLIAITVVPLMSRLFLLRLKPVEHQETTLQRLYKRALHWTLGHKLLVTGLCVLLLVGTGLLMRKVPVNFFPSEKTQFYSFTADLPIGSSLQKTNDVALQVEKAIQDTKATDNYNTTVTPGHVGISVTLKNDADSTAFETSMRQKTKNLGPGIDTALNGLGSVPGGGGGLLMIINGPDIATIKRAAQDLKQKIDDVPGLADVHSNVEGVRPQVTVAVDNVKAAEKGLNPAMIAGAVRDMLSGESATTVVYKGKTTDVNLKLNVANLNSLDVLAAQKVQNMVGDLVAIGDVANVQQTTGAMSIQRLNQQEYVSLSGKFTDPNSSGVQKKVEDAVKTVKLPSGVSYYFEGETKMIGEGFTNMFLAIGVSIMLVYMVMMVAFGEMMAPLAILFSLPFIFVGAILGLLITGESLGMPALVGILMLIGIVVTNAIVLIDRVITNRKQGMNTHDALLEAGATRIRPILMTAVATIGALIPLALSTEGGLISRSLAVVVISGLTTSTILTLVIVPIAYMALDRLRSRLFRRHRVRA